MFGGWGLYSGDLFVALIANDEMFVKVDAQSQPQFVAALCKPFVYEAKSKVMTLSFWTVPAEAMDAAHLLAPWAQLAVQAALRARVPRSSKATRAAQESTSKQTSKHKRLR